VVERTMPPGEICSISTQPVRWSRRCMCRWNSSMGEASKFC
jgi:hypothetical protein